MIDPITEGCRQVRDKIVQQYGGLDGLFDHLEKLDRKRLAAEAAKRKSAKKKKTDAKQPGRGQQD